MYNTLVSNKPQPLGYLFYIPLRLNKKSRKQNKTSATHPEWHRNKNCGSIKKLATWPWQKKKTRPVAPWLCSGLHNKDGYGGEGNQLLVEDKCKENILEDCICHKPLSCWVLSDPGPTCSGVAVSGLLCTRTHTHFHTLLLSQLTALTDCLQDGAHQTGPTHAQWGVFLQVQNYRL